MNPKGVTFKGINVPDIDLIASKVNEILTRKVTDSPIQLKVGEADDVAKIESGFLTLKVEKKDPSKSFGLDDGEVIVVSLGVPVAEEM